ncbi:MAG: cupin domain-containing protein [Alphaproteobacteria bacterium]|jgi:quercetin dioxygenase-like cupin family protein
MTDGAKIVRHAEVPLEEFPGGATYRTIVGDEEGSTPVRCGIQTSPPGYATPNHAHPYAEVLTVLEGEGEAWIEDRDGTVGLAPGMTVVFPAGLAHGFLATGETPLVTYGIHTSPDRIVEIRD